MDKQEIIEGNKLIAEFMGWTFEIIPDEYGGELIAYYGGKSRWRGERPDYLDQMMSSEQGYAFHCDWNKLMPVVEKIERYFAEDYLTSVITENKCSFFNESGSIKIKESIGSVNKFTAIYTCCINFIKWYNSQKQ